MIAMMEQKFAIEMEMTGGTRERAAELLAAQFGTEAVHVGGTYDRWTVRDRSGREWRLEKDLMVRPQRWFANQYVRTRRKEYGMKLVTPLLPCGELSTVQETLRRFAGAAFTANASCNLSVHIDAANHNQQSLKNLVGIMFSKEDLLFRALQVDDQRAAEYCKKVREPMLAQLRALPAAETKDLTALENIWYEGDAADARNPLSRTRKHALNLHSVFLRNTVEWRFFRATFQPELLTAYVHLCLAMSAQAINQRSATMKRTVSDNDQFTLRVMLVRMGLNGDEFKESRKLLLQNCEGDKAWRHGKENYPVNQKKKPNRAAVR